MAYYIVGHGIGNQNNHGLEPHLGSCQTYVMAYFYKNSYRLKAVYLFSEKKSIVGVWRGLSKSQWPDSSFAINKT